MPWKIEFALKIFHCIKYFYISGFLRNLRLPWKQSLSWNVSLYLIYFLHSGCLSNFCLPWKTEDVPNSLYLMYFLSFRILNILRLPWKTEFSLKLFTVLNIVFTFRIFEQLVLSLKNRVCPEFTILNIYFLSFRILNNLCLPWKTEFSLKFFTVFEIFFIFQDFWATWAWPENRIGPEFFNPGGGRPPSRPPRLVRHCLRDRGTRGYAAFRIFKMLCPRLSPGFRSRGPKTTRRGYI